MICEKVNEIDSIIFEKSHVFFIYMYSEKNKKQTEKDENE